MALITDPDSLSQGTSTSVVDMVFSGSAVAATVITSAGSHLPALAANEVFEVRDHSVDGNNGLYEVDVVNSSTASYDCTKLSGANPTDSGSEAASVLGKTGAAHEKSVFFDTALKKIWLIPQGNLTDTGGGADTGATLQAIYSFVKEEWKADATLIPYAFPMVAITPEQFEFVEGWSPVDDNPISQTRKLIRTGGWREYDANDVLLQEWTGIVTLGTFEDTANDLAYYQVGNDPTDTTAGVAFTFKGPVNEPIKGFEETPGVTGNLVFTTKKITRSGGSWVTDGYRVGSKITIRAAEDVGNIGSFVVESFPAATELEVVGTPLTANADDDTAICAYNHRSAIKLFLRMRDADANGKTYAQSKLADIGVTSVDNKVFRFPLTNATDLKISETDVNIAANSPYTQTVIRYFDQAFTRDIDGVAPRSFGIVIDVGTHSGVDGVASTGGTVFTSAEGGIVDDTRYDGGTLIVHEGPAAGTYTLGAGAGDVTATTVTITGDTFPGDALNASFTIHRATPVVASAEEIYEKVQYLLRQASDIDSTDQVVTGKTADALLTFVGDTLKAGASIPTNPNGGGTGVNIEGFDADDTNRLVFYDNSGDDWSYPFLTAGTINFNSNLVSDGDGYYWMFFQYSERFTNVGFAISGSSGSDATITSSTTDISAELTNGDYIALSGFANTENNGIWLLTSVIGGGGPWTVDATKVDGQTVVDEIAGATVSLDKHPINSPDALIVNDADSVGISGAIAGASVAFSFDYDGNVQGARTAATDAAITIRAIGLDTAQFVETTGTITRATGLSFSVVSGLERNYTT